MLPDLDPDSLHLFIFGPGTGELVAVCAPPGRWLVVDGCGHGGVMYAEELLEHYSASPELIVLTHPHEDHYKGLAELVDRATQGEPDTWPVLGLVMPPEAEERSGRVDDLATYLSEGGAEHAVSAIFDKWDREPRTRWTLQPGSSVQLGAATIRAVSPSEAIRHLGQQAAEQGQEFDSNQLSAALLVEWSGRRIVLGADLPETPGNGWSSAFEVEPTMAEHAAMKVPHHGSEKALHEPLLGRGDGQPIPSWIATPFASKDLPRLAHGGGADRLLEHVAAFDVTALPRAHDDQADEPLRLSINELRPDGRDLVFDQRTIGFPDCYLVLSFPNEGEPAVQRGPGSVQVTR